MAKWKSAVITDLGKELMAKVLSGSEIEFTKIKTSDHKYSNDVDLSKVISIPSIKQEKLIDNIEVINKNTVSIYSNFSNKDLEEGYDVRVVGLYAKDSESDSEILYSLTITDRPDYLPSFNGVTLSSIDYKFVTAVGNAENVILDITDGSTVTQQQFQELKGEVNYNKNQIDIIITDVDTLKSDVEKLQSDMDDKLNVEHDKPIYEEPRHGLRVVDDKLEYFNGYDWKVVDVDPKSIRDIDNIPLRVQVSTTAPTAETGRIYYNSKDNLYYIARNNQWYRLFVGGDEKLDREPPTTAPKLVSRTDTIVELEYNEDMEFRYQGSSWQEDNVFKNLQRNETYKFEQRYNADEVYKASPPSPALSVTTDKGTQTAPNAPTVKDIDFDRVTVTGDSNTEVRLNSGTWHSSPHTFTGLTEETEYTAYARKKETNTHKPSPQSNGTKFTTPAEAFMYGFEVDETNLNPKTAVTYINGNVGFTPVTVSSGKVNYGSWEDFIKKISYRVMVKNGVEQYKVQYDNPTKKLDGSNAILTGADGDLFTKFIPIWRKYTKTTKGYKIELSDKPFTGAKSLVTELENGYNQFNNPIMILLQDLYLLLFKDRNSQTALGRGYVNGNSDFINTGGTNGKGFIYGETTGKLQMCFLGIEDLWGNKFQWVDGLVSDSSYNILTGTKSFNDNGTGYSKFTTGVTENLYGYAKTVQGGDAGYVLADKLGSTSTGYCDYGHLHSGKVAYFGGHPSNGDLAGVFSVRLNDSASSSTSHLGARLCFKNSEGVYVGNYLGYIESSKLRSKVGVIPTGDTTIGAFRTAAKANN